MFGFNAHDPSIIAAIAVGWAILFGIGVAFSLRRSNASVSFSGEEEAVRTVMLAAVPLRHARHILDQGFWLRLRAGETLLKPGRSPTYSLVLGSGQARLIKCDGRIERRGPGAPIPTEGYRTAVLDTAARLWCAPAHLLQSVSLEKNGN